MGVSKFNAEGYYDPTAYEGIKRAEESMNILRIEYPSGYIQIKLDNFFPCTLDKARRICSLVNQYSSESDKDRLQRFFQNREDYYYSNMAEYAEKTVAYTKNSRLHKEYFSKFKEFKSLYQQIKRNKEIFEAGRDASEA